MQRFLDTQGMVMLAYLGAQRGVPAASLPVPAPMLAAAQPMLAPVPMPMPAPAPMAAAAPPAPVFAPPAPTPVPAPAFVEPPRPSLAPQTSNGHSPVGWSSVAAEQQPAATPTVETPAATLTVNVNVAAPAPAPAAAPRGLDRQQLEERLLSVVSERTGYPPDMLDLDADLEADLGIDSIKRVEIAGTMVRSLAPELSGTPDLEQLATSRTLRAVSSTLERLVDAGSGGASGTQSMGGGESRPFDEVPAASGIGRYTLRPIPAGPASRTGTLAAEHVIVVVDDLRGVSDLVADRLVSLGQRVVVVRPTRSAASPRHASLACDLDEPASVAGLVTAIHARFGPVGGVVHLGALRPGADQVGLDGERWQARWTDDVRGLFLLVRALLPDLQHAAANGGAAVLGATALGGAFGVDAGSQAFYAGHGGISGLLKTLATELPGVRVKAVDLPPAEATDGADWLLGELLADDRDVIEVGYLAGRRTVLDLVAAPLGTRPAPTRPLLDEQSVVLITGGARGITAEVAVALASQYRPTLVLVGRTPLPAEAESAETAAVEDPMALRRIIADRLRRADPGVKLGQVEAEYRRVQAARDVRQTLARLVANGARVEYLSCDVRDRDAFADLIGGVYRRFGRIDGVIHGAGTHRGQAHRRQAASIRSIASWPPS